MGVTIDNKLNITQHVKLTLTKNKEANQKIHVISTINCTKLSMRRKNNVQEEC